MPTPLRLPRLWRALAAYLALAATLVAAGTPLLHVNAHLRHGEEHVRASFLPGAATGRLHATAHLRPGTEDAQAAFAQAEPSSSAEHRDGEAHLDGLHQGLPGWRCLQHLQPCVAPTAAPARIPPEPPPVAHLAAPVRRLHSRALPPGDPARAPPLV